MSGHDILCGPIELEEVGKVGFLVDNAPLVTTLCAVFGLAMAPLVRRYCNFRSEYTQERTLIELAVSAAGLLGSFCLAVCVVDTFYQSWVTRLVMTIALFGASLLNHKLLYKRYTHESGLYDHATWVCLILGIAQGVMLIMLWLIEL